MIAGAAAVADQETLPWMPVLDACAEFVSLEDHSSRMPDLIQHELARWDTWVRGLECDRFLPSDQHSVQGR